MRLLFFLTFLFCLVPCASAINYTDFIDYVNGSSDIHSVHDIKYNPNDYTPTIQWNKVGRISGWIDIVGYTGLVQKNGTFYVNQLPEDCIVELHGIKHHVHTGIGSSYSVTSFESQIIDVWQEDNQITVLMEVTLKYKKTIIKWSGVPPRPIIRVSRYSQTERFSDTESFVPSIYPAVNDYNVTVYYYNNTVQPKSICSLDLTGMDTFVEYLYKGESVQFEKYSLNLEHTDDKNFPYANLTLVNRFYHSNVNRTIISPVYNTVWISGPYFDEQNFSVVIHNPYVAMPGVVNVTKIDGFGNEICWFGIIEICIPIFTMLSILRIFYFLIKRNGI